MKKNLLKFSLLILLAHNASAQINSTTYLVAHYTFDGNTNDVSANANNGTQSGGITYLADANGTANSAAQFDGIDDFITIPASTSLKFPAAQSFSIVTKVKAASNPGSTGSNTWNTNVIFSRYGCSQDKSADIISLTHSIPGVPTFGFRGNTYQGIDATKSILDAYHTLIAIKNGSTKKISFYVDGVLISENVITSTNLDNIANIASWIGKGEYCTNDTDNGKAGNLFKGTMDYLQIFSRVLTPAEITGTEDVIAHYTFDGNTNDNSVNANNGTQSGGITYVSDANGTLNAAAQFDGIDDFITIPASASLKFPAAQSFTILTKIKAASNPGSTGSNTWNTNVIFSRYGCSQNKSADIISLTHSVPGVPTFGFRGNTYQGIDATKSILDAYHTLAAVKNGATNKLSFYVDGVLISENAITSTNLDNISNIASWIGKGEYCTNDADNGKAGNLFKGTIDDLIIYGKALTASEISTYITTGVEDEDLTVLNKVFPNPSSGEFTLITVAPANIVVTNINGSIIENFSTDQDIVFGNNYTSGIYFVKITIGISTKVVKLVKL